MYVAEPDSLRARVPRRLRHQCPDDLVVQGRQSLAPARGAQNLLYTLDFQIRPPRVVCRAGA